MLWFCGSINWHRPTKHTVPPCARTMPHSANRARSVSHLSSESAKWQIWPPPMFVRPMLIWSLFVLARLPRSHYAEKRTPLLMWLTGRTPRGARGSLSSSLSWLSSAASTLWLLFFASLANWVDRPGTTIWHKSLFKFLLWIGFHKVSCWTTFHIISLYFLDWSDWIITFV